MICRAASYLFLFLGLATASAQLDELQGLNGLQDIPLSEISQQDDNPLGAAALALHPEDWKHAEGEHFIYHYVRSFVATRVSVEAEFNFRVIAKELDKPEPSSDRKSHIYIFERPEDWTEFQKAGHLEQWTGGLHSDGSLFIQRDPSHKFSGYSLGHEIAHLLIYRYYGHNVPIWLNEGFAEYISRNSRASYQRARHYLAKPHSSSLAPGQLIPLPELMGLPRAPDGRVDLFYDECERLVRFLAQSDHERFLRLLDALAGKQSFDQALLQTYAGVFYSRADFDTRFETYVTKDYGTTLQDQQEEP